MSEFASKFAAVEEFLKSATGGIMGKLDAMTFKMLVNNLKDPDYQVVCVTLEQLGKEKRPIAIPPVYYVYTQHPDPRVREKAKKALAELDTKHEVEKLTKGKTVEDAVKTLISHYGNFRR